MSEVRDAWTDERLDDLNQRVDLGFGELRGELRGLRQKMHALHSEMNSRFDSIQRSTMQLTIAMTAAIIAGFGGMAALLAASV